MTVTPDAAWGEVKYHYSDGVHSHVGSFHIGAVAGLSPVPPFAFQTPGVAASVHAVMETYLKPAFGDWFDTTWALSSYEVWQNHGASPQTFVGSETITDILGTQTTIHTVLANEWTYSFKTALGNPAKLIVLDGAIFDNLKRSGAGLQSFEIAFVNAWTADTNILGHDGSRVVSLRDRTGTLNRRLRRAYHLS